MAVSVSVSISVSVSVLVSVSVSVLDVTVTVVAGAVMLIHKLVEEYMGEGGGMQAHVTIEVTPVLRTVEVPVTEVLVVETVEVTVLGATGNLAVQKA